MWEDDNECRGNNLFDYPRDILKTRHGIIKTAHFQQNGLICLCQIYSIKTTLSSNFPVLNIITPCLSPSDIFMSNWQDLCHTEWMGLTSALTRNTWILKWRYILFGSCAKWSHLSCHFLFFTLYTARTKLLITVVSLYLNKQCQNFRSHFAVPELWVPYLHT